MEKICVVCGNAFEGRSDATVCGSSCRSKRSRLSVATDTPLSVANEKLNVANGPKDATDKSNVATDKRVLDLVRDLKLDLVKDLGIYGMTPDGIFIRDDITEGQVQNIRRLVEAKRGWPQRKYDDAGSGASTIPRCPQRV
jgi:hypothetical protein